MKDASVMSVYSFNLTLAPAGWGFKAFPTVKAMTGGLMLIRIELNR
jgi:hypothetical protein